MTGLDLDGPRDELITVKRSVLLALNRDAKRGKTKAEHERSRRERWRKRALAAEAQTKEDADEIAGLRRDLYTALTETDSVEAYIIDHEAGMAWEIGDPHGPV